MNNRKQRKTLFPPYRIRANNSPDIGKQTTSKVDIWSTRLSSWSQVGVLIMVIFGYFYTVLPVYQNNILQENNAKLHLDKQNIISNINELKKEKEILTENIYEMSEKIEAHSWGYISMALMDLYKEEMRRGINFDNNDISITVHEVQYQLKNSFSLLLSKLKLLAVENSEWKMFPASSYKSFKEYLNSNKSNIVCDGVDEDALINKMKISRREYVDELKESIDKCTMKLYELVYTFKFQQEQKYYDIFNDDDIYTNMQ